jgi:hypothetical protein
MSKMARPALTVGTFSWTRQSQGVGAVGVDVRATDVSGGGQLCSRDVPVLALGDRGHLLSLIAHTP